MVSLTKSPNKKKILVTNQNINKSVILIIQRIVTIVFTKKYEHYAKVKHG